MERIIFIPTTTWELESSVVPIRTEKGVRILSAFGEDEFVFKDYETGEIIDFDFKVDKVIDSTIHSRPFKSHYRVKFTRHV